MVGLRRLGVQPERTLCGPLVRPRHTAEIVHEGLKLERPIVIVDSLGGWRPSSVIADASMANVDSLLLVRHELTLDELIGLLIGGREAQRASTPSLSLRRAGVAADAEAIGRNRSLVRPTQGDARLLSSARPRR